MTVVNLRGWRLDSGIYTSPHFPDYTTFDRCRKFFIRALVEIDCDEKNKVIKINVGEDKTGKKNQEKLERLGLMR